MSEQGERETESAANILECSDMYLSMLTVENWKALIISYQARLAAQEAESARLRAELDEVRSDFESFQEHHRATEASLQGLRESDAFLRGRIVELEELLAQARAENERLKGLLRA